MYGSLSEDGLLELDDLLIEGMPEEKYFPDERIDVRPSEEVQSKLMRLMPGSSLPVSSLHTFRNTRR